MSKDEWIKKADDDLRMADIIIEGQNPPSWGVCYHCQQAVEKYLKTFFSMLYERTALSKLPEKTIEKRLQELKEEDKMTPDLVSDFFRMFFSAIVMNGKTDTNQSCKQKKSHHYIVSHFQSSLSTKRAKIKSAIEEIIPKMIFGKSTKRGEISGPSTWLRITNLPRSSAILDNFACCFFVNIIDGIVQQAMGFVKRTLSGGLKGFVKKLAGTGTVPFIFMEVWQKSSLSPIRSG